MTQAKTTGETRRQMRPATAAPKRRKRHHYILYIVTAAALALIYLAYRQHQQALLAAQVQQPTLAADDIYCQQTDLAERASCLFTIDSIPELHLSSSSSIDYTYGVWNRNLSVSMAGAQLVENTANPSVPTVRAIANTAQAAAEGTATPDAQTATAAAPASTITLPTAKLKTRGNTTYDAGRKYGPYNYKLTFSQPVNLFGFGSHTKWVLLPNFIDRSAVRQFYFSNLAQLMMGERWSPQMKYVELYINDEYRGLYLVAESIEEDTNRLGLAPTSTAGLDAATPFIVQMENGRLWRLWNQDGGLTANTTNAPSTATAKQKDYFLISEQTAPCVDYPELNGASTYNTMFTMEYPEQFATLTSRQASYVRRTVSDLYSRASAGQPLEALGLDLDAAVNYYLFDELFWNTGFGSSSVYLYQSLGGPIVLGPLWDFDQLSQQDVGEGFYRPSNCDNNLYRYLLTYPEFRQRLAERLAWFNTELQPLAQQALDALEGNGVLRAAVERNQALYPSWGLPLSDLAVWQNPRLSTLTSWSQHLSWLRQTLYTGKDLDGQHYEGRTSWLASHMGELR